MNEFEKICLSLGNGFLPLVIGITLFISIVILEIVSKIKDKKSLFF